MKRLSEKIATVCSNSCIEIQDVWMVQGIDLKKPRRVLGSSTSQARRWRTEVPGYRNCSRSLRFSILFAMAGIGTNGIAELLEKLVKIIKEEHVLDPSDRPVAQFVHPEELKVKIKFVSFVSTGCHGNFYLLCYSLCDFFVCVLHKIIFSFFLFPFKVC